VFDPVSSFGLILKANLSWTRKKSNSTSDAKFFRLYLYLSSITRIPGPLIPVIARMEHARCAAWRRSLSRDSLFLPNFFGFLGGRGLVLPRLSRSRLSQFCCNGFDLLLSSCLSEMKRRKNSSCSACGHQLHIGAEVGGQAGGRPLPLDDFCPPSDFYSGLILSTVRADLRVKKTLHFR